MERAPVAYAVSAAAGRSPLRRAAVTCERAGGEDASVRAPLQSVPAMAPRSCSSRLLPVRGGRRDRRRSGAALSARDNEVEPSSGGAVDEEDDDGDDSDDERGGELIAGEDFEVVQTHESAAIAAAEAAESEVVSLGSLDLNRGKDEEDGSWARVVEVCEAERGEDSEAHAEQAGGIFSTMYFDSLLESHDLMYALTRDLQLPRATLVQAAAIPWIADDRDVVICSQTGSGKTLAYLLPIVEAVDSDEDELQAMVVAPSRELAVQIANECERVAVHTDVRCLALIGGANPARQLDKLRKHRPHIVVGTPGRLVELVRDRKLRLSAVNTVVADEVDQCIADGFVGALETLLAQCPARCQRVFASATADRVTVKRFALLHMKEPVLLRVERARRLPASIEHFLVLTPARKRIEAVKKLMFIEPLPAAAICFVGNQDRVDVVAQVLRKMNFQSTLTLRGDADKVERADVLRQMRAGKARLLVATEIAARGLDLPAVSLVINLDLPTDADHYIHRAGRCGRAGAAGKVVSLSSPREAFVVNKLEEALQLSINEVQIHNAALVPPGTAPRDTSKESEKRGSQERHTGRGADRGDDRRRAVSVQERAARKRAAGARAGDRAPREDGQGELKSRGAKRGGHPRVGNDGEARRRVAQVDEREGRRSPRSAHSRPGRDAAGKEAHGGSAPGKDRGASRSSRRPVDGAADRSRRSDGDNDEGRIDEEPKPPQKRRPKDPHRRAQVEGWTGNRGK